MKKGKLLTLSTVICLILILSMLPFMGACAKPAPAVTKIACTIHLPPPPAPPAPAPADAGAYRDFAKRVGEVTEGRVTIENYWGSSLGKVGDFIKMVGSPGVADAGVLCSVYHKWEVPLSSGVFLPFLTSNLEAQQKAFMEIYTTWKPFQEEWDEVNCEVIWLTTCPNYAIGTVDKPIQTLDDVKDMKIWAVGYYADVLKAAGVKVVSFPGGEIYEALAKGVIEGAYFPYTGHYMFGFWELLKYETNTDFIGAHCNMMWVVNKDVWNQISKDDQKAMKEVGAEMVGQWLANLKAENLRVNEVFIEEGMEFYELSTADQAKWYELAGPPIHDAWLAEMDKRGQGDDARELLKRYKALIDKYEPEAKYEFIFPK